MRSIVGVASATVLLGCSGSSGGTATRPEITQVTQVTTLPLVCLSESPIVPEQIGTVNTIVVPPTAEFFDGSVEAVPDAACPGDLVSFVVSIENTSGENQPFSPTRGLIFSSGGMAKWSLARLTDLEIVVQPGDRLSTTVTGTIPPVGPGTYGVGPEGAGFSGQITVLDPTLASGTTAPPLTTAPRCRDVSTTATVSLNGRIGDHLIQVDTDEPTVCTLSGPPIAVDALIGGEWTSLPLHEMDNSFPGAATAAVPLRGLVLLAAAPACPTGSTTADKLRIQFDDGVAIVASPGDGIETVSVGCAGSIEPFSVSTAVTFEGYG